ncbi:hypothetical protein ACFL0V_05260 [Nanoarchaeota archaeon]
MGDDPLDKFKYGPMTWITNERFYHDAFRLMLQKSQTGGRMPHYGSDAYWPLMTGVLMVREAQNQLEGICDMFKGWEVLNRQIRMAQLREPRGLETALPQTISTTLQRQDGKSVYELAEDVRNGYVFGKFEELVDVVFGSSKAYDFLADDELAMEEKRTPDHYEEHFRCGVVILSAYELTHRSVCVRNRSVTGEALTTPMARDTT